MVTERTYTTGEIAKLTGVNFRTVIRWIERGEMIGYKLPGRGDHRVIESNLFTFLVKHSIPVPKGMGTAQKQALVVDDDRAMADAIARVLRRQGWAVHTANDGFEAGMKLVELTPELMTLDLRMPFMDGLNVLKVTREKCDNSNVKILVISGQGESDIRLALQMGADGFLMKPFENEVLINHVNSLFTL